MLALSCRWGAVEQLALRLERQDWHAGSKCLCGNYQRRRLYSGYIRQSKSRSTDSMCSVWWICTSCGRTPLWGQCSTVFVKLCMFAWRLQGFSSVGEVLCGHSGFQAAAALPQFALVAVQSHLLQGGGGRQRGDVGARGGSWEGKKEKREKMHLSCCNFSSFLVTVSAAEKIRATGQKIPVNPVTLRETPHI